MTAQALGKRWFEKMAELLLGIDIGTSACKVAVFDTQGKVIMATNGAYDVLYPQNGYAEQRPLDWWIAIAGCIKKTNNLKVNPGTLKLLV